MAGGSGRKPAPVKAESEITSEIQAIIRQVTGLALTEGQGSPSYNLRTCWHGANH